MLSDTELVHQFFAGNEAAFETIVRRYEVLLLSYALQFFQEREGAEDMCQSVWIQFLLSHPLQARQEVSLRPWLLTVLHRRCIDEIRREKKHLYFSHLNDEEETFVASLKDGDALPEEAFEAQEERQRIAKAIDQLPSKYRAVLWLQTYQDLSCAEIAQSLSWDPDTVKTRLYRARSRLRQILVQRV
jgi:RNA polymerase sigma-70 factor, ECF subfamily